MKAIFKKTSDNVSTYNRSTNGYEFIGTVETLEDFYDKILELEQNDYYPQKDGTVLNANGNEIFDPNYPERFNDVDYNYFAEDVEKISPNEYDVDAAKLRAIENENPYNLDEIKQQIG